MSLDKIIKILTAVWAILTAIASLVEKIADAVDPVNTNKDLNNNKMN